MTYCLMEVSELKFDKENNDECSPIRRTVKKVGVDSSGCTDLQTTNDRLPESTQLV